MDIFQNKTMGLMEELSKLGMGSKVLASPDTLVKFKGIVNNSPMAHAFSGMGHSLSIIANQHIPPGKVVFMDSKGNPVGGFSITAEVAQSAMEQQIAKLKEQADTIDDQITAAMQKDFEKVMTQAIKNDLKDTPGKWSVETEAPKAPEMQLLEVLEMNSMKLPAPKGFLNEVNGSVKVVENGGLMNQLNSALKQNERLAKENSALRDENNKLRAHHNSCMPDPPKEDDSVSVRFGNIAENL